MPKERQPVEDVLSPFTLRPLDEDSSPIRSGQLCAVTRHRRFRPATGNRADARRGSRARPWGHISSVRRTVGWTIAVVWIVASTACGGGDGGDSETQVPSETSSTTTSAVQAKPNEPATTAAGANCADLAAKAVRLAQDARATMRGIAGPTPEDEAKLRAREQALRADARRLGCPVPPGLASDFVREAPP